MTALSVMQALSVSRPCVRPARAQRRAPVASAKPEQSAPVRPAPPAPSRRGRAGGHGQPRRLPPRCGGCGPLRPAGRDGLILTRTCFRAPSRQAPLSRRSLALAGVAAVLGSGLLGAGEVSAAPQRRSGALQRRAHADATPSRARRRPSGQGVPGLWRQVGRGAVFGGHAGDHQADAGATPHRKALLVRRACSCTPARLTLSPTRAVHPGAAQG